MEPGSRSPELHTVTHTTTSWTWPRAGGGGLHRNEAPWWCAALGPSWEPGPSPNLFSAGLTQLPTSPTSFVTPPGGLASYLCFASSSAHEEGL